MNEISRRAQSIHHIASTSEMNNLSTSLSDSSSNIPNELNLSDNNSRNINNSISFESTLPKKHISSQSTSASQSIETINTSNEYSQNLSDTINLQHSDNGLTVFTVGHLTPRQQTSSTPNLLPASNNDNSCIPHIDNTSPQRASNTMRVHRGTFVPAWSVPP